MKGTMAAVSRVVRPALALTVAGLCLAGTASAQVVEEWRRAYSPSGTHHWGNGIALDDAGSVYFTGQAFGKCTTIKYDSAGNQIWLHELIDATIGSSEGNDVQIGPDGSVYVAGWTTPPGLNRKDLLTIRYAADGTLLWWRIYNGAADRADEAWALAIGADGSAHVAGTTQVGSVFHSDMATLKYDKDGNLLWARTHDGTDAYKDVARAIALDSAENVVVAGGARNTVSGDDGIVIKYDKTGNKLWQALYDGTTAGGDGFGELVIDSQDNVICAGRAYNAGTFIDLLTVKYSPAGVQQWASLYNGPIGVDDGVVGLAVAPSGNVYIAGISHDATYVRPDYATVKYDSNGNEVWVRRYGAPSSNDVPYALTIDHEESVYVAGTSSLSLDMRIVKYDVDGTQIWVKGSVTPIGSLIANEIVVDDLKNVYIGGHGPQTGTGFDMLVIKYIQAREIKPNNFTILRGSLAGGGIVYLFLSDDLRLEVRAGLTLFLGESPLQVYITGTSFVDSPSELRFKLESSVNTPGLTQTIELYNFDTSSYEQVDLAVPGVSDGIVEAVVTTNPGRFVQLVTREMRARISYRQVGLTLLWPWTARLDQAVWTIAP